MDGQGYGSQNKNSRQHPGDFGQKSHRAARAEGRLAGSPKGRSDVHVFAALEQNRDDEQHANEDV